MRLGATSLVVSHDVHECFLISRLCLRDFGRTHRRAWHAGRGAGLGRSGSEAVHPAASPMARCASIIRRRAYGEDLRACAAHDSAAPSSSRALGPARARRSCVGRLGHSAFFFIEMLQERLAARRSGALPRDHPRDPLRSAYSPWSSSPRRASLVGLVLACRATTRCSATVRRNRSGILVALSLVRELGPVVAGLLFAEPRRLGAHGRDRADEGERADRGDGDDGGRSDSRACWRRASGGHHLDAAAGGASFPRWASSAAMWSGC